MIILDATLQQGTQDITIIIKAESQEALSIIGQSLSIRTLKDIIMSPASKLYKIATYVKVADDHLTSDYEVYLLMSSSLPDQH